MKPVFPETKTQDNPNPIHKATLLDKFEKMT